MQEVGCLTAGLCEKDFLKFYESLRCVHQSLDRFAGTQKRQKKTLTDFALVLLLCNLAAFRQRGSILHKNVVWQQQQQQHAFAEQTLFPKLGIAGITDKYKMR